MGRRKSRKENGRHACALGARWREAGVSRLRAEVLRNFLSVNRGIKEGAGASRPVLARVGRLRAAVSLAVPALVSQGLPEACPRPLSGWGGAYTGSEPSTPEPRPCFPSVGSPGGRNLQVGLGEEDVRAGGRTASWHSSCGGAQVTDSWATWRAGECSRSASAVAGGTSPSLKVTSKSRSFPKLQISGRLPPRDRLKLNLRGCPGRLPFVVVNASQAILLFV